MPHVPNLGGADAIDRTLVELPPIAQRSNHDARIDIIGNPGNTFKGTAVIEHPDLVTFIDATGIGVNCVNHHKLLALNGLFVHYIAIAGIQEGMAFGRDDVERIFRREGRITIYRLSISHIIGQRI